MASASRSALVLLLLAAATVPLLGTQADSDHAWSWAIDSDSAGADPRWGTFDTNGPTLADLDGDGRPEIIDQNQDRRVVVLDAGGRLRATLETAYPPFWGAAAMNQVAVGGAGPSLFVANSAGVVTRFRFDGEAADGGFRFEKVWERRLDAFEPNPGMDAGVTLADLDGDGGPEVLAQTESAGIYALHARDGATFWSHPLGGGDAAPAAGDLDGDGRLEAVFGSDGGMVTVLDGPTGKVRWTAWLGRHVNPGSISAPPTIADLDGDGRAEVLVAARDAHDPADPSANHMAIAAFGHDGVERWVVQPAWANPLNDARLVAADTDGDGRKEVFGMDWNTMGHLPGNWQLTGPAHAFALAADGAELWHVDVENWWSDDDIAVVDADGDGQAEVLAVGVHEGRDGLLVLDARTGAMEGHASAWPYMVQRGPEVADLDGDGRLDWVVSARGMAEGTAGGGFLVFQGRAETSPEPVAPVTVPPPDVPAEAPAPEAPAEPATPPGAVPGPAPEPGPFPPEPLPPPPPPPARPPESPLRGLFRMLGF